MGRYEHLRKPLTTGESCYTSHIETVPKVSRSLGSPEVFPRVPFRRIRFAKVFFQFGVVAVSTTREVQAE